MSGSEKLILGDDFLICRDEVGRWALINNETSFPLDDSSDFRKVISLLEMPIETVRLALGPDFPYISVIKVGLGHDSDYWIKLAIFWIAHSSIQETISLVDDLRKLSVGEGVSQGNRHFARRELKRILKAENGS
ncbi:hypothetical protein CER19_20015 [Pseudomonas sp. GL93]|uniref:hypothetical protein n=1 Tax=Pseudomonas sp. GL93 TaxID=2014741 RepID=UPI000E31628A|nr:hypothetical protein [Pseudomonas sp. GL93]RFD26912.1 hypothetical protein CER19_20015 [Pseudomonas sp. GL93]